jgi:N-acetylmuramate 1-kinase
MVDRAAQAAAFLQIHGWGGATSHHLAGDASDRTYTRVVRGTDYAVLMDAPPGTGDDPAAFVRVAQHLAQSGLSVPLVLAQDLPRGFLLLEDLGDAVFARVLAHNVAQEAMLYGVAVDVLVQVQHTTPLPDLPDLTAQDWATAALYVLDWYQFGMTGQKADPGPLRDTLTTLLQTHADGPRVLIHRDYHAENLIWLPDRAGMRRAGILDFQLLQMGQPAYDLVSLLQDARRDVSPETQFAMQRQFLAQTGATEDAFSAAYAVLGAQRALRILGIFARLCTMAGKPQYLLLLPRVWHHLQTNLAHPALASLRAVCDYILPAPTPENIAVLSTSCAPTPAT